jgi:hypothetical protein
MSSTRLICVRTLGRDCKRYVCCGEEGEEITGGQHPRVAAVVLAERLSAGRPYSLRECNPWQYDWTLLGDEPAPCTSAPASPVQKPEVSHP